MKAARLAWFDAQLDLDPDQLVFINETAAATNMARRHARSPRGQRCRIAVPQGHDKTTTVTAALRASGPLAVALVDGATNGIRFRAYVTNTLAPALKPGAQARRHGGSRQPPSSQGQRRARNDRARRRTAALPAALLAGLQPDRATLR